MHSTGSFEFVPSLHTLRPSMPSAYLNTLGRPLRASARHSYYVALCMRSDAKPLRLHFSRIAETFQGRCAPAPATLPHCPSCRAQKDRIRASPPQSQSRVADLYEPRARCMPGCTSKLKRDNVHRFVIHIITPARVRASPARKGSLQTSRV